MSTEYITDPYGTWAVDWTIVRLIVRSHANSLAILNNGVRSETSEVDWYNPFSWGMPDVVSYDVNWNQVRRERDRTTNEVLGDFRRNISNSVPGVKDRLQSLIFETESNRNIFRNNMNSATRETMRNINSSVEGYETAVSAARITRDVSAEVFLVGATFLSGGTAALAIAGGSAFKGVATFQDTGNVGAALIETTGSFIITIIPVARGAGGATAVAASRAETIAYEGAVIMLDAQFEVAKGLVSGDTLQQAIARGGLKVVTAGVGAGIGEVFKTDAVRNMLAKTAIPATMQISRGAADTISTLDFAGGVTSAVVNQQAVGRVGNAAINSMVPGQQSQSSSTYEAEPQGQVCLASEGTCARLEMLEQAIRAAECSP